VKIKLSSWTAGLFCATLVLLETVAFAQDDRGDWALTGADAGQSGWQKDESVLTLESVAANFKFLWKIQLGKPGKEERAFSEPLLAGRLINGQGFKDIVYWSSADTLYAVDSELGTEIWTKQFSAPGGKPASGCGVSSLGVLMEPPVVINFRARARRAPGTPRPPAPPVAGPGERRLGVAPGGGYFGLKGIYILTPDGMLHEQVMTTGVDFAPPVKFLPAANGGAYGINFADKTIYTATGRGCGGIPNGVWAIDLSSADYPVTSYATPNVRPLAFSGPALMPDGTSIFVTGAGNSDAKDEMHPGSVVSLTKELKVQDWYTPSATMASYENVSPITFTYKEKQYVVAPGSNGSVTLLDAASLGGTDHKTPLFETSPLSKPGEKHVWDGFASWQEKSGTVWVFASVSTGISLNDSTIQMHGQTSHGGVVAFRLDDTDGKLALNPVWVSQDMVNPAPPRVANGIVVALSSGNASTHAALYVLNASTGAELYSSKDQIPTYTEFSGVSIGDGHAFFTDRDNVLYSFGIGLEH
jgi:outer membrane protein assembly factor BamB